MADTEWHCPNLDEFPQHPRHFRIEMDRNGYYVEEECHRQRVSPYYAEVGEASEAFASLLLADERTPKSENEARNKMLRWASLANGPLDADRAWEDLLRISGHWIGAQLVPLSHLDGLGQSPRLHLV